MIRTVCLLLLGSLVTCARGDCDACVAGRCHSRHNLLQKFDVTDQLAIDRTNNVVYAQLNHNLNIAISLDKPNVRLVHTMNTTGMAVDQKSQVLYAGNGNVIYGFKNDKREQEYEAEVSYVHDDNTSSAKLLYTDVLYTINTDGSCYYFKSATGETAEKDNLKYYEVSDMVNVMNITNWVFVADDNLYKFVMYSGRTHLISKNKNLLSTDKYGDIYVRDAFEKVIYKLGNVTDDLEEYASYKTGFVEDFVFDKDNNIIFRDADDTIARWIPEQKLCYEDHQTPSHIVNDFVSRDNYLVHLLLNLENYYNPVPEESEEDSHSL